MASLSNIARRLQPRLCLIGPPGSGKGSYGRMLAARQAGMIMITASAVLKERKRELLNQAASSGKLIDDNVVSEALLDHLEENINSQDVNGYILDGFPRTIQQVELMESSWPKEWKIDAAIHLNVPSEVCEKKMLGRRICSQCGGNFNVANVVWGGFDLPPQLPKLGQCHRATSAPLPQQHQLSRCDPDLHWKQREDDEKHIIQHRLELYTQHTRPILEHFASNQKLFEFIPYKGYEDMPQIQAELEEWLSDTFSDSLVDKEEASL
jgi:adenylate kinase